MPEAIRMLHFADIHIGMENYGHVDAKSGVNQRVLDFILRLREIIDYAIDHEADLVIFAGDAFKTRDPNPTYLREFSRQIMRLSKASVPVVLLVGNHDMPLMDKRASSVDIFRTLDVPGVIIGHEEKLHRIETRRGVVQVATVPWPLRSRLMASSDELRRASIEDLDRELERVVAEEMSRLAGEVDRALPAVLTGHFTVGGAKFGSERNVMIGRDAVINLGAVNHPAWDYVALGHIHKHQDVSEGGYPGVVYSGSLERIDFGESGDKKGFVWVELARGETRWKFMPVQVRSFITIDVDATNDGDEPTDAALRAAARHDVTGAVVRMRVKLLDSQVPQFRVKDVEQALGAAHFVAGIGRDVIRTTRHKDRLSNPEGKTPLELVETYFVGKNMDRDHIDELMTLAKTIVEPGQ